MDANLDNTDLANVPYEQLPSAIMVIERQNQELARQLADLDERGMIPPGQRRLLQQTALV